MVRGHCLGVGAQLLVGGVGEKKKSARRLKQSAGLPSSDCVAVNIKFIA